MTKNTWQELCIEVPFDELKGKLLREEIHPGDLKEYEIMSAYVGTGKRALTVTLRKY